MKKTVADRREELNALKKEENELGKEIDSMSIAEIKAKPAKLIRLSKVQLKIESLRVQLGDTDYFPNF